MNAQNPGSPNQNSFETPFWESRDKEPFERGRGGVTQIILYGGRWWLPPNPGRGESSESRVARGLFPTPKVFRMQTNQLVVGFECRTE
jgi:hypothetical protein